jgi:hypothetical protein
MQSGRTAFTCWCVTHNESNASSELSDLSVEQLARSDSDQEFL